VIAVAILSGCFMQEVSGSFLRKAAPKGKGEEGDAELKETNDDKKQHLVGDKKEDKKEVKTEAKVEKKEEKKEEKQEEKKEEKKEAKVEKKDEKKEEKQEEKQEEKKEEKKEVKKEAKAEKKEEKKAEKKEEKKEEKEEKPGDNFVDEAIDQADPEFGMMSGGDGCMSMEDALEMTMAMFQNDAPANADVMSGTKLKKQLSVAQNAQLEAMKVFFGKMDRNHDGCVNKEEFKLADEFEAPLVLQECDEACDKRLKLVMAKKDAAADALTIAKATAQADALELTKKEEHGASYEKDFQEAAEKAKDLAAEAAKDGASSKAKEAAKQASKDMDTAKARHQASKEAQGEAKAAARKSGDAQESAEKSEAKMREEYKEFKEKAKQAAIAATAAQQKMVFDSADRNADGYVSWPEAVRFVGDNMPQADLSFETLQNMFSVADVDNDEFLSEKEFTEAGKKYKGDGRGLYQVAGSAGLLQKARSMIQYWYPTSRLAPGDIRLVGNEDTQTSL